MILKVNGEPKTFQDGLSINDILEQLQIKDLVMACALNMKIVKQIEWATTFPKENDELEFLNFVGGG